KNRTQISPNEKDSIVRINFSTGQKDIIALPYRKNTASIAPKIGNYQQLDIIEYVGLPKLAHSNNSLMLRTRDLFDSIAFYPASTVTKIVKFKDGKAGEGCTATFVGGRFLITAA